MNKNRKTLKIVAAVMLHLALAIPAWAQDSQIYWQNGGGLYHANLDGTGSIEGPFTLPNSGFIYHFVVDNKNSRIFSKDLTSGNVYRAGLDLSNPEIIFSTASSQNSIMDYDQVNDKLVLSDLDFVGDAKIIKLDPDGSNPTVLYQFVGSPTTDATVLNLNLHSSTNKIYFRLAVINIFTFSYYLYSMDLSDGGNLTQIADLTSAPNYNDMTISPDGSKIYLVGNNIISEIDVETLQQSDYTPAPNIRMADFSETLNQLIIYSNNITPTISKVNTDGSNSVPLINTTVDAFGELQVVETSDRDNDGTPDSSDNCPLDATKVEAGQCGCGSPDTDTDSDGTADCVDLCDTDSNKVTAGTCGCGVSDADSNNNGLLDCFVQDSALAQSVVVNEALAATTYKDGVSSNLLTAYRELVRQVASSGVPGLEDELRKLRRAITRLKFIKEKKMNKKQFNQILAKAEAAVADIQAALRAYQGDF